LTEWTKAHTHTKHSFDRDSVHPLPFFHRFYSYGALYHDGRLFNVVKQGRERMGGDEYRCMGNLISRTFVDLRHKTGCGSGEIGRKYRTRPLSSITCTCLKPTAFRLACISNKIQSRPSHPESVVDILHPAPRCKVRLLDTSLHFLKRFLKVLIFML